jgi:hypothetical protein
MLLLSVTILGVLFSSASSRPWKATPNQIAAEYAQINDQRKSTDLVIIKWLASPTVRSGASLAAILEKYIVISVVHVHSDQPLGAISFDNVDTLEVRDGSGKPLAFVPRNELPPAAIEHLSALEVALRQSLGRFGDGIRFFAFDAGAVRVCEKGGISIPLAGETCTWETPFPGCPSASGGTEQKRIDSTLAPSAPNSLTDPKHVPTVTIRLPKQPLPPPNTFTGGRLE